MTLSSLILSTARHLFAALMLILLWSCGGGGSSPALQPLTASKPIDGVINFADFATTSRQTLTFLDSLGGGAAVKTVDLQWGILHDDRDVYVALQWNDTTYDHVGATDFDGVSITFDVDGDGLPEPGEDRRTVIAANIASQYVDQHLTAAGALTDTVADGQARLAYDAINGIYTAEFLFPYQEDANGEDALLTAVSRYNIELFDHFQAGIPTGNVARLHPEGNAANWPLLPLTATTPRSRPQLPTDLTGLIVFLSDRDHSNREVYTFNPATRVTTQITTLPGLFKDAVSLSHDRTRVAFHGTPNAADFTTYEIYTLNIDGTGLTALTSNTLLDGHPAWSPDDSHIAYASFREGGKASIVVMDSGTGAEIADLTPVGDDDNDPDYLPDGRIVFKTDRFSAAPQVRMAVMAEDGSGLIQISSGSGNSDHDAVANDTHAVFERFSKATNFSTDPEALFSPWDLVEVTLDGASEQILLSDGWVNWLPVYDPSDRYIAYQKSVGYTELRLRGRDGTDYGRLIPDTSSLQYFDWK